MAEMPFFPLATDAFLADTDHLDDAERGRYVSLLIALWRAPNQRLPNDDAWLARKFKRSAEEVASQLRPLIAEFCQSDGNWITQKRISKEYKRATKAVNQRRDAANSRWLKEKEKSERIAASYGSRNAPTLIPTPTLIQSSLSDNHTDPARAASLTPSGFAAPAKSPAMNVHQRVAEIAASRRKAFMGNAS
jgi:uncharacterized protein YdaU (DUF1376 family)